MPTVDRKNDTDEKHSLSSFDKRKVQSVTFGARQIDRKKYRVVKHGYGTVAAENVSASLVNNANSDETTTFRNNPASSCFKMLKAENNANMSAAAVSTEVAQRMQRAAYIRQMNNESISRNISSAKYVSEKEPVSTENAKSVEMNFNSDGEKRATQFLWKSDLKYPNIKKAFLPKRLSECYVRHSLRSRIKKP